MTDPTVTDHITEEWAANVLRQVVAQGLAREFVGRVCFGNDFFVTGLDGTIEILNGDLLKGMTDG